MIEIAGYEGLYAVAENGDVFSIKKNRFGVAKNKLVKPHIAKGYLRLELNNKGGVKFAVHRLVCIAYHPNPENKPEVNHLDGNKLNCHKDNVEWATSEENIQHAIKLGLIDIKGEKNCNARLNEAQIVNIRSLCSEGKLTQSKIGEMYGLDQRNVSRIYKRKLWKHVA